ncbi:hypothetical protein M3Y97_00467500 [Aphelenchoides bicaudatus]|nr:hypothetical protein M3Y97_00467500 [Aphelenchoides bicaudatus]
MDLIDYGSSSSSEDESEKRSSGDQKSPSLERQSNGHVSDGIESDSIGYDLNSTPKDAVGTPTSLRLAAQDSPQQQTREPRPVYDYEGLPPSPPGSCNEKVAERFVTLFNHKDRTGLNMNSQILNRKEFKNPAIYDKLKEDFGVDEYGTNYLSKDGDCIPLDPSDFYDKLSEEQTKIMERDEQLKRATPPVQDPKPAEKKHRHSRK